MRSRRSAADSYLSSQSHLRASARARQHSRGGYPSFVRNNLLLVTCPPNQSISQPINQSTNQVRSLDRVAADWAPGVSSSSSSSSFFSLSPCENLLHPLAALLGISRRRQSRSACTWPRLRVQTHLHARTRVFVRPWNVLLVARRKERQTSGISRARLRHHTNLARPDVRESRRHPETRAKL